MPFRGDLIFKFLAEIAQLDTEATAEDPDGAGPLESGYDADFREPLTIIENLDQQVGPSTRAEKALVRIPCQIESDVFEALNQFLSGNAPDTNMGLVFHYKDLEKYGLVDATTGDSLIGVGDRLNAIYTRQGKLVQAVENPPGLYIAEARPIGFGLDLTHPTRNLLLCTLGERKQGVQT